MNWDLIIDVLRNSLLITGLVIVMMLMIEFVNVYSSGKWFASLQKSKPRQVLLGSILGLIPGCIGGFAAVSLYSHRLISFGALVAMMICSSGDEAFVMLAMIPKQALLLFAILFVLSFVIGIIVDKVHKGKPIETDCDKEFEVHQDEHHHIEQNPSIFKASSYKELKKPSKERIIIIIGLVLFIAAIFSGILEHDHEAHHHAEEAAAHFDILNERWLNIIFACLSVITLLFCSTAKEHFIKEHIWGHIIKKHALSIFLWTLGALTIIQFGLQYLHIEEWIQDNKFYILLLAAVIGMIPESGPHMVFISLFATGLAPFSVLLTSSISQDGHTSLPLLASSKKSFVRAKLLNVVIAIAIGSIAMLLGF